jgi:hypothetical protein
MKTIAVTLFFLVFIVTVISIVIGIKKYNSLKELKILILIPILSLVQNLFVELFTFITRDIPYQELDGTLNNIINKISVYLYIFFEYSIIVFFIIKLFNKKSEKTQAIILYFISILVIIFPVFFFPDKTESYFKYFQILNGLIAQYLIVRYLYLKFSISGLSTELNTPKIISTFGILLSYSLIWPSTLFVPIIEVNIKYLYFYFVSINLIGYLIFFTSLSIAFYGKNK